MDVESEQNPFELLGVAYNATDDQVTSAFRRLVKKLHPDVNPDPSAGSQFARVKEAYDRIRTAEQRTQLKDEIEFATRESSDIDVEDEDFSDQANDDFTANSSRSYSSSRQVDEATEQQYDQRRGSAGSTSNHFQFAPEPKLAEFGLPADYAAGIAVGATKWQVVTDKNKTTSASQILFLFLGGLGCPIFTLMGLYEIFKNVRRLAILRRTKKLLKQEYDPEPEKWKRYVHARDLYLRQYSDVFIDPKTNIFHTSEQCSFSKRLQKCIYQVAIQKGSNPCQKCTYYYPKQYESPEPFN